jgi:hypothetical protein
MTTIREMAEKVLVDDKDPRIVGPTENEVALARAVITLSARVEELEKALALVKAAARRLRNAADGAAWDKNTSAMDEAERLDGARLHARWGELCDLLRIEDRPWMTRQRSLVALVAEEVAKEREACVKLCYEIRKPPAENAYDRGWNGAADTIERAIRSRSAP